MFPISNNPRPKILIFRNELLPASETFVLAQASALHLFETCFAGVHAASNCLRLPTQPMLLDDSSSFWGKLRRRVFWRSGVAPDFHRRLKQLKPALIHAHFAIDAAAALPIAQRLRVPLVVTLHGYDVTSSDKTLSRSPEGRCYLRRRRQLWEEAAAFVCISRFLYDRALAAGFPRAKLRVHYTGTDFSLFTPSQAERDPNLIVFVGRLVEKKGCRYLLDALEVVRRTLPDVRLVCIGDGPLRGVLQAQAAAANLPCTFVGPQSPVTVRNYLAQARIFCVPSVEATTGDSEGLGMVFVEAQAMGTPVVSFRHGGIPEVVLHGHTGLLAPERNRDLLAAHLLTLLQDDNVWRRFSERGAQWVSRAFDLANQTLELEAIYRQVLQSASCPAFVTLRELQPEPGTAYASTTAAQATSSPQGHRP
jgi:glycosyltransferase involved in cell wall biosynthesis